MARTFIGYKCEIDFTLPVPPGFQAVKERVIAAEKVPKEAIYAVMASLNAMLSKLSIEMTDAGSPMEGWSPFSGGLTVTPTYIEDAQVAKK